jgi:hypothetical protein
MLRPNSHSPLNSGWGIALEVAVSGCLLLKFCAFRGLQACQAFETRIVSSSEMLATIWGTVTKPAHSAR